MIAHCILWEVVNSSPILVTGVAIVSAAAGAYLTSIQAFSRRLVPFSGGVLVGVALFWVLPEMADALRWPGAIAWTAAGFALLWSVDRFVYPVCPACSHTHEHDHCETRLHGFAAPLLIAAAMHSLLDGWGAASTDFGPALAWGIAFHKIPEGIALGVIVRASLASRAAAVWWCALAESATLAGAALESMAELRLGSPAVHALLAVAGGSFLYLGGHAIHGELRRSGPAPAFFPALTGVAGSSVLRLLMR